MRIIKLGKAPEAEPKEITCIKCTSVLEYVPADTKQDRDGKYIICPCCKQFINV